MQRKYMLPVSTPATATTLLVDNYDIIRPESRIPNLLRWILWLADAYRCLHGHRLVLEIRHHGLLLLLLLLRLLPIRRRPPRRHRWFGAKLPVELLLHRHSLHLWLLLRHRVEMRVITVLEEGKRDKTRSCWLDIRYIYVRKPRGA